MTSKIVSNDKQFVIDYLNQLGLKAVKNNRQFWKQLDSRHKKAITDQLSKAMDDRFEEKGDVKTIYNIKNQNLRLSLDVSNFSADMYRRYFEWFVKQKDKSSQRILDLGCDNGIVTCFYAVLFPQSEIVGIDILDSAVQCSRELAQSLNLSNITFLQSDLKDLKNYFPNSAFDLITSLRSFHEIMNGFPEEPRYWSIIELLKSNEHVNGDDLLLIIKDLLRNETSEFISCERLPWLGSIAIWANTLEASGLHIKWDVSEYINFHELESEQRMPILITGIQSSNIDLLEQVYTFEAKDRKVYIAPQNYYKDALAEVIFYQIEQKEFISGFQVNFVNGSGKFRSELWKTNDLLIVYLYSNIGYREIKLLAQEHVSEAKEELLKVQLQYPGQEIIAYHTIQEREDLG